MYKIINAAGRELGRTERPYFIRLAENGSLAPCSEEEAQGVAVDGAVYNLFGAPILGEDFETVVAKETDGGKELDAAAATNSIIFVTMAEAGQIDNVTATENADQFEVWSYPITYKAGAIRRDPLDGALYQVNEGQAHTSQSGWNPSLVPALWTKIGDPSEEWPAWSQPIGAHDAYEKGAKVSHNEKKWISDDYNNVWEPGVYGWTEYIEEDVANGS